MNELTLGYISGGSHDMSTIAWIGLGVIIYVGFLAFACLICGANGKNPGE